MIINKDETKIFLNQHFSKQIEAAKNNPTIMAIVNMSKRVYELMNDPEKAYASVKEIIYEHESENQRNQNNDKGKKDKKVSKKDKKDNKKKGTDKGNAEQPQPEQMKDIPIGDVVETLSQQLFQQYGPEIISHLAQGLADQLNGMQDEP